MSGQKLGIRSALREKECVHTRQHSIDPIFVELCQNIHLNTI